MICQLSLTGSAGASIARTTTAPSSVGVKPNAVNELDCNGWSKAYKTVRKLAGDLCTDPTKIVNGKGHPYVDNGWYVGHDEPGIRFISSTPGSGNTFTVDTKLPVDPAAAPNRVRKRHQLRRAVRRAVVGDGDVRLAVLPAEPVHAGQ